VALDAFVNPGDAVVLFDPCSTLYSMALKQRRARIRWVPTWQEGGHICFHPAPLRQAMSGAKLVVVNTPSNPTGGILAAEELELIARLAARHDVLIFSDEVFQRYQYDGPRLSIAQQPRAEGRTLIAGSVSKSHALAAARVGWLAGHRHLVRPGTLTAALQGLAVPTLCQRIAAAALRQSEETYRPIRTALAARRHYVHQRLTGMGLQPDWPAGAFYFWVPIGMLGLSGRLFAERLLADHQVLVCPGGGYGPNGSQHIRLSFCGDEGRLREGLNRLESFVSGLQCRLEGILAPHR
jgi:aspartate/methionine/tyrosine aminotransferase